VSGASPRAGRPDPAELDPGTYLHERYEDGRVRNVALRAFYAVKPLLPRRLQLALRRRYARRQARRTFPAWPIEPLLVEHQHEQLRRRLQASGRDRFPLVNFWPDGHRFAAVVTHDVESAAGIENIGTLLELERRHKIVSSWNFVAEDYRIPDGTFDRIRAAGGEIGLHGITHDGKLFSDRRTFEAQLAKIHRYLRAWDVVGFRSPGTRRNADWMPDLGCLYDSSFPDTDPFEPQSGGCCSIFPFFLGDLVELPITLPQDHTLWEILRVPSIDVWRDKTEWLISHHGLVNVIVHPDYVASAERLELYDELLGYLGSRLDNEHGWHALPRDIASWWKAKDGLRIEGPEGAERIGADNGAGAYLERATVAWAHERDGALTIDS
jgi:peptidoglycan/xylan/chitin deacetylase (PgdA/CDA1 family)